jgi:hypothetical protein
MRRLKKKRNSGVVRQSNEQSSLESKQNFNTKQTTRKWFWYWNWYYVHEHDGWILKNQENYLKALIGIVKLFNR